MASIKPTVRQKTVLRALVDLYSQEKSAVNGEIIAEEVDRNSGTIRNQMQSLKTLQLVESIPGAQGGYKPTSNAYEILDIQELDRAAEVPLSHNGERLKDNNVVEVDLTSVHHPDLCRAEIKVRGPMRDVHEGDEVTIGPTPLSNLIVDGTVDGKDDVNRMLILEIEEMVVQGDVSDN